MRGFQRRIFPDNYRFMALQLRDLSLHSTVSASRCHFKLLLSEVGTTHRDADKSIPHIADSRNY